MTKPAPNGVVAGRTCGGAMPPAMMVPTGMPGGKTPPSPEVTSLSPASSGTSAPDTVLQLSAGRLLPTTSPAWPVR